MSIRLYTPLERYANLHTDAMSLRLLTPWDPGTLRKFAEGDPRLSLVMYQMIHDQARNRNAAKGEDKNSPVQHCTALFEDKRGGRLWNFFHNLRVVRPANKARSEAANARRGEGGKLTSAVSNDTALGKDKRDERERKELAKRAGVSERTAARKLTPPGPARTKSQPHTH